MESLDTLKLILEAGDNASGMGTYYVTVMLVDTILGTIGWLAFLYLFYRLVKLALSLIPTSKTLDDIAEVVKVDGFSSHYKSDLKTLIDKIKSKNWD